MDYHEKDPAVLVGIARIGFLSLSEKIKLLKNIDSASSLALISIAELEALCGRRLRVRNWDGELNVRAAVQEAKILELKRIGAALYCDAAYPALLREIPDAPFMLFYTGDISVLGGKTVSVVGTRQISADGIVAARDFAYAAAEDGVTVISGLAFGADGAAHSGAVDAYYDALENGAELPAGRTAAALPCGCDTVQPASHVKLARRILSSGGCLVSEYVPGVLGERWRFVHRNRIVAALSPATVIIQAANGSGALITAQYALEYGRDVVFHQAAFSESAKKLAAAQKKRLEKDFALGRISRAKLESCPEKYLDAGAPVVKDYRDFCACLRERPGERSALTGDSDAARQELPF